MKKLAIAIALFAATVTSPAFASQAAIDIVNDSSSEIVKIQMSDIDADDMGYDLLGRYTLPAGQMVASLEPSYERSYCRYDLLVTFEDGGTSLVNDFNACEAVSITIHDGSFEIEDLNGHTSYRRGIIA